MNEISRLFTALILSMAAIFAWNYFFVDPKIEEQRAAKEAAAAAAATAPAPISGSAAPASNSDAPSPVITNIQQQLEQFSGNRPRAEVVASSSRVSIEGKLVKGSINLTGGMVDDLTLSKYREALDENSDKLVLLSPLGADNVYFVSTSWVAADSSVVVPGQTSVWKLESGAVLTKESPVVIRFDNGQGLVFRKKFSLDERYMITTEQTVENRSGKPASLAPYGMVNRSWDLKRKIEYIAHEGPVSVAANKLTEVDYADLKEDGPQSFKQVSGWVGIGDKYWLTAIIPHDSASGQFDISYRHYNRDGVDRFQADILAPVTIVQPSETSSYVFDVYAGAKRLSYLEEYSEQKNITLFDRAIDFGSLYFLTKPLFKALTYFHDLVGNMGYAIMLLTVMVRIILFPLANASYKSMARMKKHMPEITAIRERFKSDKQKQGTEMMKYYKDHRINPAAGCLPILIQIPVFFALYKVLSVTIEMRHEPFIWFVLDLSAKDPTNILMLFGLLPWSVPAWLPSIGILPILFSLTMVIQQKLNPPMADETQRVIMAWLPWIFLFVFAGFASGLVIYWIWNNILSILQQWVITRKIEEDKSE